MCIYDSTRYACTGEEISLVLRCPMYDAYGPVHQYQHNHQYYQHQHQQDPIPCIPHIRFSLFRTSVCQLCALAGLEAGAVMVDRARPGEVWHARPDDNLRANEYGDAAPGLHYMPSERSFSNASIYSEMSAAAMTLGRESESTVRPIAARGPPVQDAQSLHRQFEVLDLGGDGPRAG